jgi:hypothetical protein
MDKPSNAPASATAPGASDGDPKTRACTAFNTVSKAVPLQTNGYLGPDPVAQAAVAANARLALFGGGQYLLTASIRQPRQTWPIPFAHSPALQGIGMNALAGLTNSDPDQAARLAEADATRKQIVDLCK